ncbi:MAG: AIM24 family protein [Acidobacteriota bacterium]|nr:AIM24 family protein [Acidobacteriota bacterium]
MSVTDERIACRWCRAQSPSSARTCDRCGAPLDGRDVVADSGWRAAPRLRDLTEFSLGGTRIQIDGTIVPVADVELGPDDSIFFEHHAMLWKDDQTSMSVMDAPGGARRMLGDLPFVLSVARGPGRVSCSRDAPGELVVLPVDSGQEVDVREHAMLLATSSLTYSFEKMAGLKATLAVGSGMYLERFRAEAGPGLLLLHGFGNVMDRTLAPGETIEIEPGGFLYKEASVSYALSTYRLAPEGSSGAAQAAKGLASRGLAGLRAAKALKKEGLSGILSGDVMQQASAIFTGPGLSLMKLTGPGRVGVQSMYQHFGAA